MDNFINSSRGKITWSNYQFNKIFTKSFNKNYLSYYLSNILSLFPKTNNKQTHESGVEINLS